jgi:hypothetical protein
MANKKTSQKNGNKEKPKTISSESQDNTERDRKNSRPNIIPNDGYKEE